MEAAREQVPDEMCTNLMSTLDRDWRRVVGLDGSYIEYCGAALAFGSAAVLCKWGPDDSCSQFGAKVSADADS